MEEIVKKLRLLDAKKATLEKLKPLKPEWQKKLDDKYRLEWNFHSNHIEGNTLTYGETQMLLFFGRATGEHEKREYDEMEAHDAAIKMVNEWASDDSRDITASELRELNRVILVKPFWKEAITPDGQSTRKEIIPGDYKTSPNSVRLKNGEIHQYASPQETPAKMDELMQLYQKREDHPVIKAAWAHHEFTAIHPFDDGNGRVARLWVNYILLRAGFPPLIIRVENKEKYLTALQKADLGDLEPFIDYLIEELNWSLDKAIDAAKEKPLEEPGDLEKRISLLDKRISTLDVDEVKVKKSEEVIQNLFRNSLWPLFIHIDRKLEKVRSWFNSYDISLRLDGTGMHYDNLETLRLDDLINNKIKGNPSKIEIEFTLEGFKKAGPQAFSVWRTISISLEDWKYTIRFPFNNVTLMDKLYDGNLNKDEIDTISEKYIKQVIDEVEDNLKRLK